MMWFVLLITVIVICVLCFRNGTQKNVTANNAIDELQAHKLNKNELTQGSYIIGKDIPEGFYDFFVVFGSGGKLDIGKYGADGKIINGTWSFYWIGLKEEYENRELIHIECKEGYTVKLSGNIVVKIARSQKVQIDL